MSSRLPLAATSAHSLVHLHLVLTAIPFFDVVCLTDSERSTSVDERGIGVTVVGGENTVIRDGTERATDYSQLLVLLRRSSLYGSHESGSDPDTLGTVHQTSGESSSVIDTSGSNDMNLHLSE